MIYTLDTNIIIHLIINTPTVFNRYENCLLNRHKLILSPYVDFEIRRGLRYKKATKKEQIYERLSMNWSIRDMGHNVWLRAVDIYSDLKYKGLTVSDADILIAAFCLENKSVLVTNNTKDFINIVDLTIEDWVN